MSKRTIVIALAFAAIALLGTLYYYYNNRNRHDWREGLIWWPVKTSYLGTNREPYGLNIFFRLIHGYFPEKTLTRLKESPATALPIDSFGQSIYFFIGEIPFYDSAAVARLSTFVQAGNTAVLAAKELPVIIIDRFVKKCSDTTDHFLFRYFDHYDHEQYLQWAGLDQGSRVEFAIKNEPQTYRWSYFRPDWLCESLRARVLGRINDTAANAIVFPFGKGNIILHSTPLAFTNYNLIRREVQEYTAAFLSQLSPGNIYWDEFSQLPQTPEQQQPRGRNFEDNHPLKFLLSQPPLAWAWYLLVSLAVLYVFFAGKRRQRIVPVLPKNENTSFEFIHTIADLHFRERNYRTLCWQNMRLFLAYLRERYGFTAVIDPATGLIKTEEGFISRIAAYSEVPEAEIQNIFQLYQNSLRYEPSEDMMTDLHQAIEKFIKRTN